MAFMLARSRRAKYRAAEVRTFAAQYHSIWGF
jgi:hypothetical protein